MQKCIVHNESIMSAGLNIEKYAAHLYSLHRKKVYTCGKAKYSKSKGARGKVGGVPHHFFEFQNEAWPSFDQLKGGFGAPPTFHLVPPQF